MKKQKTSKVFCVLTNLEGECSVEIFSTRSAAKKYLVELRDYVGESFEDLSIEILEKRILP